MEEGKIYVSKDKYQELQTELKQLTTMKRREVAEDLEHAKSLGDLSENAEYHEARDAQAKLESRIAQVEDILKKAEIIKPTKGDVVDAGSEVVIAKVKDKVKQTYHIVGPEEADMATGKLSYESPLGRALIGKKKEDTFSFETPKGKVDYKIVSIK